MARLQIPLEEARAITATFGGYVERGEIYEALEFLEQHGRAHVGMGQVLDLYNQFRDFGLDHLAAKVQRLTGLNPSDLNSDYHRHKYGKRQS